MKNRTPKLFSHTELHQLSYVLVGAAMSAYSHKPDWAADTWEAAIKSGVIEDIEANLRTLSKLILLHKEEQAALLEWVKTN